MAFEKVNELEKEVPAFAALTDVAAEKIGGKVLYCTDDFFAEKENLIKPGRGIFIADKYTERGKCMDGWESRRKRIAGNDFAIIHLAAPSRISGFDIDTNFFLGNHPPHASVEALNLQSNQEITDWNSTELSWSELLPKSALDAGSRNFFNCKSQDIFTHLRLQIFPDGGVARFKVFGEIFKDWSLSREDEDVDLAFVLNGARAIACNDMFFSDMSNLIMPNRGSNMGDGWETKRNRTPGNRDWVIIKLGHKGIIKRVIVDTSHFKGNYPDRCSLEGCSIGNDFTSDPAIRWETLLPEQKLSADAVHEFSSVSSAMYTHVRLNIFPDGGVSRLRLFGKIV